jgi:dipeptidyl aminopeptidase/acylaminoacyl peptidase
MLTYGKELRRSLMIVHGVTDDNVCFRHSMKLIDAALEVRRKSPESTEPRTTTS